MQLGSSLTRFQAGIPLASQLTAARLNAMLDEIEASRMRQGVGYGFSRDSGGTSLTIASQVQAQVQGQLNYDQYNTVVDAVGLDPFVGTVPYPELSDVFLALIAYYGSDTPAINDAIGLSWGNSVILVLAICTGAGGPGQTVTINSVAYGFLVVGAITS